MAKSVYIETFGCQMNKLDSELMLGELLRAGWRRTHEPREADLALFVTCAVRAHAEEKFYSHLGAVRRLKQRRPEMIVAVAGCVAQKEGAKIRRRAPYVDLVCGTRRFRDIRELVRTVQAEGAAVVAVDETGDFSIIRREKDARPRPFQAYVSVMRGCDNYCAYCIVPYVRGPVVSRSPDEITDELRRLAEDGVVDVTLLGQNISAYGSDTKGAWRLPDLLARTAEVQGIRRLKFITSHPEFMNEDVLRAMRDHPTIGPYLHMPAQSGSDSILRAMKRRYDRAYYLELCEKARRLVPGIEISGDFIVGFPGETDQDFGATLDLVEKVGYKNVFAFKYSPRPPALSAKLADDVAGETKQERLSRLLGLARSISHKRLSRRIGSRVEALIEGPSKNDPGRGVGRTASDIIVIVDGAAGLGGSFMQVEVTQASPVALYGRAAEGDAR